jgi:hypothetical protein
VFVKTSTRKNKDGTPVRYLQLAHNEWDPARKRARTKVLYSFGRADQLDRAAIERLIGSLTRLLGTETAGKGGAVAGVPGLEFAESRPLGGTWLLDRLWHTLGIDTTMTRLLAGTRRPEITERVLFALVANRAIDPASKLAAAEWATHDVAIPGLAGMDEDQAYRAMDLLVEADAQAKVRRGGVLRGRRPAEPGGGPAAVRHHQHLLRTRHRGDRGRVLSPVRALQGPPARPAPGHHRPGRHAGGDPGAVLVLAGQHQRPDGPA